MTNLNHVNNNFYMTQDMRKLAAVLVTTWGVAEAIDRAIKMSVASPNGPVIVWAILHHPKTESAAA